ncbi:NADH-quinone oxidoreductase subunit C [Bacillus sp. CECT 9360]|uniref:NADH-quinone oxidoreductase subunit C n=1 Tax=Bacillus sp. CECT 9360 TaxID=2845821 RepID=UPI001E34B5EE|nr:NADH-quinone oxidoreductase subunit C [Bacillus sp. CECT 9360]CAH0345087.1 NAD(P)H-quinone oxidoreductase subunit J, chloroplastic [Bacillus sp. CECT 9360]
MGEEKSLEQLKKEAAEKAKAAALARRQAKEQGAEAEVESAGEEEDLAKKKAVAAAAAKSAALARKQAKEQSVEAEPGSAGEEDLAKKKAAAAAAAKSAALARKQAKEQSVEAEPGSTGEEDLAKKKAAAAAAAKAAALAMKQAKEQSVEAEAGPAGEEDLAKKKAAAVAKAKAAALAKMEAKEKEGEATDGGDLEKKKAIAAAAARAKATLSGNLEEEPTAEVPNQPLLDKYVNVIENHLGKEVLEESYINKLSKDVPTLVAKPDTYSKIAEFLKYNEQLAFNYLSELHGTDFETHMEIYIHLYSFNKRQAVALKVKIDRNRPEIPSLVRLWEGANWPECEAYDLLGIKFTGHPDLKRIMLGEDWIGHPLRKDYEPYDVEV